MTTQTKKSKHIKMKGIFKEFNKPEITRPLKWYERLVLPLLRTYKTQDVSEDGVYEVQFKKFNGLIFVTKSGFVN